MTALLKYSDDLAQRIHQIVKVKYPAQFTQVLFHTDRSTCNTQDGSGATCALGSIDKLQQMGDAEVIETGTGARNSSVHSGR